MAGNLEAYNRKRHFDTTDEPPGNIAEEVPGALRFVVQHHIASRDHYDFRLELGHVLKSWAVPKGPSYSTHDKRLAMQVEDHPLDYRNFEGTIPHGEYGGGTVMIWDEGYWLPIGDPEKGLQDGDLKFLLYGERLKGTWVLVHMKPRPGQKDNSWLLIKERDEFVDCCDIKSFTTSVRTGRTMAEIAEDALPHTADEDDPSEKKQSAQGQRVLAKNKEYPEKFVIGGVEITHPNKIMYPDAGLSKGYIAEYYCEASKRMLPYLENRLMSAVRCPKGAGDSCFYRKHPANDGEGVGVMTLTGEDGTSDDYFYLENIKGLLHEVQMGTLEFHLWGSKVATLEQPDRVVFDLDPDTGMGLDQIRQGVRDAKAILDDLSLTSFLKTTGGKGYHLVVPFKPSASWNVARVFAQNIAKLMEAKWPDRYTSNSRKNERHGRIYIDWQRNIRGATSVSPYSLRNREKATVSMPIRWDELDVVAPDGITASDALERLNLEDPWEGFFTVEQVLKSEVS